MVDAVVEGIPKDELTVERVRTEVRALTDKIAAKQLELQLMVGSRYHELIDSADSVVSMYRSCKRLQHVLGEFKGHLHGVNETRPAAHLLPPADARFLKAGPGPHALVRSNVLFMVHAPTMIWEHIDRKELLQATRAYLRAKAVASTVTSVEATTEDMKKAKAMVLRQWSYVGDLSDAIKRGARSLLADQAVREREAHASALGALCLREGLGAKGALDVYLDLRSQWLSHDLNIEALDGDVETVQLKLTRSVQAISRTILDTFAIFVSPALCDGLGLGDVALQSVGRLAVAEAATAWVAKHIDETYTRSQSMLKLVRTAHELAGVRQALWAEATVAEADAGAWREACMCLIVMDKLRSSLSRQLSMSLPYSNTSTSLDLWGVLFSRSFAALAEDLLSESLAKVKTALVQRLESVLVTIRGEHLGRLTAVEMAWAAQHMGSTLTAQVTSIGKQADSLVQEGDRHASGALAVSMRTQTLRLLAHVVAYLRVLATSLADDEQVDGLLIVVRLAWYLGRHMGVELDDSNTPPPAGQASSSSSSSLSSTARPPRAEATIDFVQLESAFTIADTRGEGTLTQEELRDALDTIGLGGSDVGLESCTLPEFALLCSPILDEQRPSRFLKEALETVFRNGLAAWATVAVRQPASSLHASIGTLEGSKALSDAVWRSRHAGWQEKLLLQEDEGGSTLEDRMWLPSHVSPRFSTFLFLLSTELSRVTQSRDGLESGLGAEVCLMEAFRQSLVSAASAEIRKALSSVQATKLCEAAVLQCTLDHLFLQQWLESGPLPGWDALQARLDPINYQMYEPTLLEAVRAQGSASSLLLSFLLHRLGAPSSTRYLRSLSSSVGSSRKTRAPSLDDAVPPTSDGSSSNTMPLVTCVPRFILLPVVVEASTPASSRLHSPPRDAHRQAAGGGPSGSSAFNFFNASEGAGAIAGVGKGVVAGGVANAATVLSSFSSLSALGNQAASTATSFLSRATAKRST